MKKNLSNLFNQIKKWNPNIIMKLFILITSISAAQVSLDNDLYFILNTGRYIIKNGIPFIEPFTLHEGFSYISQQWLTCVIFYEIYKVGGQLLLAIFIYLIDALICFIVYKLALLITNNKVKISLISTFFINLILGAYITTRPQVLDILLIVTELYLLEKYAKTNNFKLLIFLPILSILFINLHSSTYLMLMVMYLIYFGEYIYNLIFRKKNSYNIIYLLIAFIISLGVSLINPYGIDAITYVFKSYGIDEINSIVSEMHAMTLTTNIIFTLLFAFVCYSFYYNKNNNIPRVVFLFLGTTIIGLLSLKGFLYFVIACTVIIPFNFKNSNKEEESKSRKVNLKDDIMVILVLFTLIEPVINNLLDFKVPSFYSNLVTELNEETKDLDKSQLKVYTDYNTGGFFELMGYKCYIDPRAEVFLKANNNKEDILMEYYNVQIGRIDVNTFLDKYDFDYLILSNKDIVYTYIQSRDDYKMSYIYELPEDEDFKIAEYYVIYTKIKD